MRVMRGETYWSIVFTLTVATGCAFVTPVWSQSPDLTITLTDNR